MRLLFCYNTHTQFSNVFLFPHVVKIRKTMASKCVIALNLEYIKNGIFMHFLVQYLKNLFSLVLPKSHKNRASSEDRLNAHY